MDISVLDVWHAKRRIDSHIVHTPFLQSTVLSADLGLDVWFKLENLQATGSFKARGALNTLLTLSESDKARGVITASAGNHAQGVCYAARILGVSALIVVPESAPQTKKDGIRRLGGELIEYGANYDEAEQYAVRRCRETNRVFVHGFESAPIVAGQGTVAIEMLLEQPDIDTLLVPAGGGGLICGIALVAKSINPAIRVIGVQSHASPPWYYAFHAGKIVDVAYQDSLADGLHGGIGVANFHLARTLVDDFVLVDEADIARAMCWMATYHHQMIEGSAAVGIAALQSGAYAAKAHEKVACVISGGNVDAHKLAKLLLA